MWNRPAMIHASARTLALLPGRGLGSPGEPSCLTEELLLSRTEGLSFFHRRSPSLVTHLNSASALCFTTVHSHFKGKSHCKEAKAVLEDSSLGDDLKGTNGSALLFFETFIQTQGSTNHRATPTDRPLSPSSRENAFMGVGTTGHTGGIVTSP